MNAVLLTSSGNSTLTQLWRVLKTTNFHTGEFVRGIIDEHDKVHRRLAKKMAISPQGFSDMLNRAEIGTDVLYRLGMAARIDILGMVRAEMDRLAKGKGYTRVPTSEVSEPQAAYATQPKQQPPPAVLPPAPGMQITVSLDANDPAAPVKFEEILRILRS